MRRQSNAPGPLQTGSGHPIRLGESGRMAGNTQWRPATYSSAFSPSSLAVTLGHGPCRPCYDSARWAGRAIQVRTSRDRCLSHTAHPRGRGYITGESLARKSVDTYRSAYFPAVGGFRAPSGPEATLAGGLAVPPAAPIVSSTGALSCAVASERTSTICVPGSTVVGTCA